MAEFYDSIFHDVEGDSFAFIMDPDPGWEGLTDCGDFPCTGPSNTLFMFESTSFEGTQPRWAKADF